MFIQATKNTFIGNFQDFEFNVEKNMFKQMTLKLSFKITSLDAYPDLHVIDFGRLFNFHFKTFKFI